MRQYTVSYPSDSLASCFAVTAWLYCGVLRRLADVRLCYRHCYRQWAMKDKNY